MGKIRVRDLAEKMGVPEQDLLFKLKGIGVRLEGEEATIDTDVIQAIMQGKSLPQSPQREVIMRDKASSATTPTPRRRPTPRAPVGPQRPHRRRAVVHKSDPKIRTLPTKRPPRKPTPEEMALREVAEEEATKTTEQVEAAEEAAVASEPATVETAEAASASGTEPATAEAAVADEAATAAEPEPEEVPEPAKSRRERRRELAAAAPTEGGDTITIAEGMRVRDLAEKLGVKAKDLMKKLFERGLMATVNQVLDPDTAAELAAEFGFETLQVSFEEEVQLQHGLKHEHVETANAQPRPPVVTVMGHVDHGKTSLLDAIRSSRLTEAEHGGITQHIAAYQVETDEGRRITFLDTPGHEAFTQLRARGAQVTDIVILVVAADDGVMPQTIEAIQHARAADVPILVAINKMDRPEANPDRVKKELADHELLVEDWGGEVIAVPISALEREGIDELLEMILLTADMLELKGDPTVPAQAVVLEARKETGRGIIASAIVQTGTLEQGQVFVCGSTWGRVRSLSDDRGQRIDSAGPSTPVEITGFDDLPAAGDALQVVEKESQARDIAQLRQEEERQRSLAPSAGRMSLESLFTQLQEGETKELPVVVKADVQGSVEVLKDTLQKVSTEKVKVRVIGAGVGAISTNDVLLASASKAIIYGFNVRPEKNAVELAEKEEVDIRTHTVIYELTDELRKAMSGLLEPEWQEVEQGRAEVRETFKVPRIGVVAGCHVIEGVIPRGASVRLLRDNVVIYEGKISSLRRFKDDVAEVRSGFDCGIGLERFQDIKPGDLIEAYTREAIAPTL